jgi:hypothetical protein
VVEEANHGLKKLDIRWVWLDAAAEERRRPWVAQSELSAVLRGEVARSSRAPPRRQDGPPSPAGLTTSGGDRTTIVALVPKVLCGFRKL